MNLKRMIVCFLFLLAIGLAVTTPSLAKLSVTSLDNQVNWEYAYKFTDPEEDTQRWSYTQDYLPSRSELEPPILRYGNTSEWDNDTSWWKTNAPFDAERDFTSFWITWDMERVYLRVMVKDVRDNQSIEEGAIYLIYFDYWPLGQFEAGYNSRTYTASPFLWDRCIPLRMQDGIPRCFVLDTNWAQKDTYTGNMKIHINLTGNYVDVSVPWDDFKIGPFYPSYFNITLMSLKPGEWDGGIVGSYRRAFDPQDPGTLGEEWIPPGLSAGPDAADVMPGDATEIDWTWNNATADMIGSIVPENSISSWYHVPISFEFMAHHAYEYLGTHDVYVWSNRSTVMMETFDLDAGNKTLSFNVTGLSGDTGECIVTIPKTFMNKTAMEDWNVTLNAAPTTPEITGNATHTFIRLNYTFDSSARVEIIGPWIIPEFPAEFIPVLLAVLTVSIVVITMKTMGTKPFKRTSAS